MHHAAAPHLQLHRGSPGWGGQGCHARSAWLAGVVGEARGAEKEVATGVGAALKEGAAAERALGAAQAEADKAVSAVLGACTACHAPRGGLQSMHPRRGGGAQEGCRREQA
jgi:cytochrome c553